MEAQGKLVRNTEIPAQVGKPSPENAKKWLQQQIPYANFAGVDEGLDLNVCKFVKNIQQEFYRRMAGPMRRWSFNWSTANTEALWQEHEDDVHIPETKKALDNKVSRIDEAVTQFDPPFEVEGMRGELSRSNARMIGSYVYRQMELANWQDYVQPVARDGELCNIMAMKVSYEHIVELIVERKWEQKFTDSGKPYYHDERRMREAVARSGIRYHQVDPFWFIYDLDAAHPQDCSYIGDESEPFLHELEAQAERGWFSKKQVEKLRDQDAGDSRTRKDADNVYWQDQYRLARSIATRSIGNTTIDTNNGVRRVRCCEMWAWYDFGKGVDGISDPLGRKLRGAHRVVVTIADGVVLRFQLNPFDRKFVPYAVARVNKNGHEMVAPAPFDSVVQMNAHYDRLMSNAMRWMDLRSAPLVVTSDINGDMPKSLMDVKAGTVMRNVGDWDYVEAPDIAASLQQFEGFFRREHEELSGALRVFESPQGTATETERKVQEQQRSVRTSVRAASDLWCQVARLTYWISSQFISGPEVFTLVGKSGGRLSRAFTITPDVLQEDVDFRFLGLSNLHTFGNRAQGMSQWMNAWGPMLQGMPGISLPAMARLDFEMRVGKANIGEIFRDEDPDLDMLPQKEENAALMLGREISVHPNDNDEEHLKDLMPLLKLKDLPQIVMMALGQHAMDHFQQMQQKQVEQQASQQKAQQDAALQAPGGGQPGVDKPPAYGGMPAQKDQGVTPGPTQGRTVARSGRSGSGTSQSQAMSA